MYWKKKQYYSQDNNSEVHFMAVRTELIMFCCTQFFPPLYTKHYALTFYVIIVFLHTSIQTYKAESISDLTFSQWCRGGFRSVRNTLSPGKRFLTSSIPLWLLHPEDTQHIPSQRWESHTQQKSVKSWKTWLLSSTTVGNPKSCRTECVYEIIPKTLHSRHVSKNNQSLLGTYLCCLHHMVRVVVFHCR